MDLFSYSAQHVFSLPWVLFKIRIPTLRTANDKNCVNFPILLFLQSWDIQAFKRFQDFCNGFFLYLYIKEPRIFHFANVHNSTPGFSSLMKLLSFIKSEFFHQSTFFLSSFIQRSSFKDDIFINLEIKLKNYITAIYNLHRLLRAHICDKSTQITELFPSLLDTSCLNVPSLKW